MAKTVITISREFGSGGRTIAKMVADRLGYAFYDEALIRRVAEQSGFSEDFVREHGEDASSTSSFLFNLARSGSGAYDGMPGVSDKLYVVQHNIIKAIGQEDCCVIVGHCADYILKDCDKALHVFIHADKDFKADRIVMLYGETGVSPYKRLEEKDKKRKVYYKNYTGRVWGSADNFDVTLNSGKLGVDACVDIICALALYSEK
ncbi:MAG: cytidylate kinase-like family protein [Clostridia bacterium]|nr:cytidylate kinase-like family protein [Clostridia bacterium]